MTDDPVEEPIGVAVAPDAVVILSPQGPVALTPLAALESARLLLEAAQRVLRGDVDAENED